MHHYFHFFRLVSSFRQRRYFENIKLLAGNDHVIDSINSLVKIWKISHCVFLVSYCLLHNKPTISVLGSIYGILANTDMPKFRDTQNFDLASPRFCFTKIQRRDLCSISKPDSWNIHLLHILNFIQSSNLWCRLWGRLF